MLNFKNSNYEKNSFKDKLGNHKFRKINVGKIGVLGIILIFGSMCFISNPAASNASVSQSVLNITKGGTNANTLESAQKNLGRTDEINLYEDGIDNEKFPSSKATYDYISASLEHKKRFTLGGDRGLISICYYTADCSQSTNWSVAAKVNGMPDTAFSGYFWGITHGKGQFVAAGTDGEISGCKDNLDCSQSANWSVAEIISGATSWRFVKYGNGQFVVSGTGGVSRCFSENDCSLASNWSQLVKIPSQSGTWNELLYTKDVFMAISTNGKISSCRDTADCGVSENWKTAQTIAGFPGYGLARSENQFISVGNSSSATVCSSKTDCTEANNWTPVISISTTSSDWRPIVYGNGQFIAAGAKGEVARCYDSTNCADAANWSFFTYSEQTSWWDTAAFGNNMFIIAGAGGKVSTCLASSDCGLRSSWTPVFVTAGNSIFWTSAL
ncbi:MAG: hypothetical protein LBT85_03390 [Bifidobacteriaceae bacterium]|jgi:hypothetical protein|nr:hypothetical protein [Bifidobacteriaceae bacterium]